MRKYIFILFALTTALSSCVSYDAEEFTGKTLPRVTGYTTGITNDWLVHQFAHRKNIQP